MESEQLTNGSQEEDNILKPSKSVVPSDNTPVVQNGNHESESIENVENGHGEDIEITNKNRLLSKKEDIMKKESTPSKRELRPRESTPRRTPVREKSGTPTKRESIENVENGHGEDIEITNKNRLLSKKEDIMEKESTPSKRELRPRESTPRRTPVKEKSGTPTKRELKAKTLDQSLIQVNLKTEEYSENTNESSEIKQDKIEVSQETDLVSDEKIEEEKNVLVVDNSPKESKPASPVGFFSSLLSAKITVNTETLCKATSSSSSGTCIDTPIAETYYMNEDIKGRRAIKAFSRFPGRNVSLSPLKRKNEEDSFGNESKKKCTDLTESGSEKSPGWRFLTSPFGRIWSPSKKFDDSVPSSTPCKKFNDNDSMAVNYNENSTQSITVDETAKKPKSRVCPIM